MKDQTVYIIGALLSVAVLLVFYLFATTDFDRHGQAGGEKRAMEAAAPATETEQVKPVETLKMKQSASPEVSDEMSETDRQLAKYHLSSKSIVSFSTRAVIRPVQRVQQ